MPTPAVSNNHKQYPYLKYLIQTKYYFNQGSVFVPVSYYTGGGNQGIQSAIGGSPQAATSLPNFYRQSAASRTPGLIVQAVSPFGYRVMYFAIRRLNALPVVPQPNTQWNTERLSQAVVSPISPEILGDGSHVYGVEGYYSFQILSPRGLPDGFPMYSTDVDTISPSNNQLTQGQFSLPSA